MKKIIYILQLFLCIAFVGCNSDEPKYNDDKGQLIVELALDENSPIERSEDVDFSEYSIAIVPKSGFIASSPIKDIEWPVELNVGTYTIAAASPLISETEDTETYYYGETEAIILKDQVTQVKITLKSKTFDKSGSPSFD